MVKIRLDGIHTVRATLAGGRRVTYHYAWRGGPRLPGEPGSPEFLAAFHAAHETRFEARRGAVETCADLCDAWMRAAEFDALSDGSRRNYGACAKAIKAKFGTLSLRALAAPQLRTAVLRWRDGMRATPRKADYHVTTFARLISWAVDRGHVEHNHLTRIGKLFRPGKHAETVWSDDQIARINLMPPHVAIAHWWALWTGMRVGDLLALTWADVEGEFIRLRQSKTDVPFVIYMPATLRDIRDRTPKVSPLVLTNSAGRPWTVSGFKGTARKQRAKAGIAGVRFHDLRGTLENRLWEAGCSEGEVVTVIGRRIKTAESMNAYFRRADAVSKAAMTRLESTFGERDCKTACKMVRLGTGA